jgi:predicted amidohydrolase YtcJ
MAAVTPAALAGVIAGAALLVAAAPEPPADLVLTGGRVWTAETASPWAEAVAIRGERLAYVGTAAGARALRGPKTQVVDVSGRLVVPGFNDAHVHLMEGALSLDQLDLAGEERLPGVQARLRAFAARHPKEPWIRGRGWVYGAFPGALPTRQQLDAAVGVRPAYIESYDGHTAWVSSKALALAGIDKDTPDPRGGAIARDPATGEPTGALKEAAMELVARVLPRLDADARYQRLLRGLARLNASGVTSVQDAGSEDAGEDIRILLRARQEGRLTVRVREALRLNPGNSQTAVSEARLLSAAHDDDLLRFGAVKGFVDGVVESHTAALLEPYADDPAGGRGATRWAAEALNAAVTNAERAGVQVWLHAIGDRAVRMALDAFEAAGKASGAHDRRGRIEHAETMAFAEYPRFAALGVLASMQPLHATPDANTLEVWAGALGEERTSRAFSFGNLERFGARLVFGSDWPVVPPDVLAGIHTAVTRQTRDGRPPGGWLPGQAVSVESALRHFTIDGAYASFEEERKGSLAAGKLADLVVLSRDVIAAPPAALLDTRVLMTVMNGKIVYRDPAFKSPAPPPRAPARR